MTTMGEVLFYSKYHEFNIPICTTLLTAEGVMYGLTNIHNFDKLKTGAKILVLMDNHWMCQ